MVLELGDHSPRGGDRQTPAADTPGDGDPCLVTLVHNCKPSVLGVTILPLQPWHRSTQAEAASRADAFPLLGS